MSIETGVVVNLKGEPIYWHLPPGRIAGYLPDSRSLWDVLWDNRNDLMGFAHSHPGSGFPGPSMEDLTTFSAVERGLGRRLLWWICTKDQVLTWAWDGPDKYHYAAVLDSEYNYEPQVNPGWLEELRRLSY
jgi:hypothetical protein